MLFAKYVLWHLTDLSSSTKLEDLELDSNFLTGSLPESITALTSLKFLSLAINNLNGSLPMEGNFKIFAMSFED